ncbi:MAG: hypothetical protein J6M64_10350 [Oscillospiraceae bacterium]|nr:hypothetical protein [Oscillospiraceae bacterium]
MKKTALLFEKQNIRTGETTMKKTALLLCLMLVFSVLQPTAWAENPAESWQEAYRTVLDGTIAEQDPAYRNDVAIENSYLLYDVDKDGIPEMVIKTGTCEADYTGTLYTFRNGKAEKVDIFGLGHSSLYSYPEGNGIVIHNGHMGFAYGMHLTLRDGVLDGEEIFEDDLNSRLMEDENAEYIPVENFVPGARYLDLYEAEKSLPITRYEEMMQYREGIFPEATEGRWPNDDEAFFRKVMDENKPVVALSVDRYSNNPGLIGFQDLLKKDVAVPWMEGDLKILGMQEADLNGDGKLECVVDLAETEDSYSIVRCYLSEQDGTVYAYLQNYAPRELHIDSNGNLQMITDYDTSLHRLICDGEEALLMTLSQSFFTE